MKIESITRKLKGTDISLFEISSMTTKINEMFNNSQIPEHLKEVFLSDVKITNHNHLEDIFKIHENRYLNMVGEQPRTDIEKEPSSEELDRIINSMGL